MKPMTQDEALRIIRNVALPQQIVAAATEMGDRDAFKRELQRGGLELGASAGRVIDTIKKHVFHEHPLSRPEMLELIFQVRLACQDIEMVVNEGPKPKTLLDQGVDGKDNT